MSDLTPLTPDSDRGRAATAQLGAVLASVQLRLDRERAQSERQRESA